MTTSKPEDKRDKTYGDYWSGKKPYLVHDYRKMMQKKTQEEYYFHELVDEPMSELYRPYRRSDDVEGGLGWEYMSPPVGDLPPGIEPPSGWPPFGGGCELACNPSSVDCEGGCTTIACICSAGILDAWVIQDPTGGLVQVGRVTSTTVEVCLIENPGDIDEKYPKAVIGISDGTVTKRVTVQLVDCKDCCEEYTLSGDSTIDPGNTWTGTIDPACANAEVSVSSNSGCTLEGTISGGTTVEVPIGNSDCGTFIVTVTFDDDECDSRSASFAVYINNTGQGGGWTNKETFNDDSSHCAGTCTCPYDADRAFQYGCYNQEDGMQYSSGAASPWADLTYSCLDGSADDPEVPDCTHFGDDSVFDGQPCYDGEDMGICLNCECTSWSWFYRWEWECVC